MLHALFYKGTELSRCPVSRTFGFYTELPRRSEGDGGKEYIQAKSRFHSMAVPLLEKSRRKGRRSTACLDSCPKVGRAAEGRLLDIFVPYGVEGRSVDCTSWMRGL